MLLIWLQAVAHWLGACCRDYFLHTGVVPSEAHATLIQTSLRLNIVKELILNRRDGCQNARYLKKSRSLGSKLDHEKNPSAAATPRAVTSPFSTKSARNPILIIKAPIL